MSITYLLTMLINGIRLGSVYALIAVGYSMVYGILRLINFAHGDVMTLGVYFLIAIMNAAGCPYWASLLLSVALSVGVGLAMERVAYRPLRAASEETVLISSLAVSTILQNLMMMVWSAQRKPVVLPEWLNVFNKVGPFTIKTITFVTFGFTVAALITMTIVIRKTRIGVAMQACSENQKAAMLMGININRVIMFTFAVGSALAAVAGVMMSGEYGTVYPSLGFTPSLKAFCAAVIGGIGSLGGSVVGAFSIGIAEMMFAGLVPTSMTAYRDAFVFAAMIVVLLFRPNGLFGAQEGGRS